MSTPVGGDPQDPATAFGLHMEKSLKHAFNEQGLSFWDLSYVLHGLLGRLLALEIDRKIDQAKRGLKGDTEREPQEMDREDALGLFPSDHCEGYSMEPYDPEDPEGEEWKPH